MALGPDVRVHRRIREIGREAWDACAAPSENPFTTFDFLDALEESGCAVEETGWGPHHLAVRDPAGAVAAVMPLYVKSHSFGEYVFDHAWAEAWERAGGRYYPKLQTCVPFTPATGPRLMVRPDVDKDEARSLLVAAAMALCERFGASSWHVTFPTEEEHHDLGARGMLLRQDRQFWWENKGYADFDGFLADLSASRRKTIRRERREAQAGLRIETLSGPRLTEDIWDAFFDFYQDTGARKWGQPYLNRRFFGLVGERMADRIVLVLARRDGRPVAGALNFVGADALYGRWWGTLDPAPFLHFELCYYQAVEYAIRTGLRRVEAGAQGEHKLARGYLPKLVYSAHHIADPRLREAIDRYLVREREAVADERAWLEAEHSPFRRGEPGDRS